MPNDLGSSVFDPELRPSAAPSVDRLEAEFPGEWGWGYIDGLDGSPWPELYPSPAYHAGREAGIAERLAREEAGG